MNIYFYIWLAIIIGSIILEIVTFNSLVSIWFSAGALVSLILNYFKINFQIQIITFFVVSLLFIIILRPIISKYNKKNTIPTNTDRLVGKQTHLLKDIDLDNYGILKINDLIWNAISIDNQPIKAGNIVEIISIDGSKLIVKKII